MAFKKNRFLLELREVRHIWYHIYIYIYHETHFVDVFVFLQAQRHTEHFTYTCASSHDAKHLWKSAIEHHTFFR